ncbi:MAG: hypothetical protein DME18_15785, partial [Verrucomicrobia bacterium]
MRASEKPKRVRNWWRKRANESNVKGNFFDNVRESAFVPAQGRMKPVRTNGRFKGLTLIEVIVVIAVIAVLIGIVLPWWANSRRPSTGMACSNHLKQVGVAAHIFANDNDDRFPWQISTNTGGSHEYQPAPNSAFRHFQVMSNELSTPIILVCPQDRKRAYAMNWVAGFDNRNVSYF